MALKNLFGKDVAASACGTACGTNDKPEEEVKETPSACGSACGAADKPEEPTPSACGAADKPEEPAPSACGTACGAGDKE